MEFVLLMLLDLRTLAGGTETVAAEFYTKENCIMAAQRHILTLGDTSFVFFDLDNKSNWAELPEHPIINDNNQPQSFRVITRDGKQISVFTCAPK